MDSEILYLILLTASIFAMADGLFAHGPVSVAIGAEVTRTFRKDKGGTLNGGYPAVHGVEKHHGNSEDGGSVISKYDRLAGEVGYSKQRNDNPAGYSHRKNDRDNDGKSDAYNYKHGYIRSHGYRRHHHRSDDDDKNKDRDDYHGYHSFRFEHDREGKNGNDPGCGRNDCGSHYDHGFEFHYGNNGKERDEHIYDENSDHGEYNDDYEHDSGQSLGHDHNEGVDDHRPDYHYGYTGRAGNYGKDYPNTASDHHYRHREQDHDRHGHRYGLVRSDR